MAVNPQWYYDHYDEIFAYRRDYAVEASLLDREVGLVGRKAVEIGAGTGRHSCELLKSNPAKLTLYDRDPVACALLAQRFEAVEQVDIVCRDAFRDLLQPAKSYDVAIAMYSVVLLNSTSLREISGRVSRMLRQAPTVVFEALDGPLTMDRYPNMSSAVLIDNSHIRATIQVEYPPQRIVWRYRVEIGEYTDEYVAELGFHGVDELIGVARALTGVEPRVIPLEPDSRRFFVVVGTR